MSVEAGKSGASKPAPLREGEPAAPQDTHNATQLTDDASTTETMEESEELRRRRRQRRRRTVADLPPAQKRFRLILLGLVILAIIAAANGKGIRPIVSNFMAAVKSVLPIDTIKHYLRPELALLMGAAIVMLILLFPDVEEKVLVALGFQKARRPHRSRSSRSRTSSRDDS